jgi:hypothetical protein
MAEEVEARSATVRLPGPVHVEIQQLAREQCDTFSSVLRQLVRAGLASEHRKDFK